MSELTQTSKTLSYWLRHAPEEGDFELDGAGWADTKSVLAALQRRGFPVSQADLAQIVRESDKNRFELTDLGDRIRARQGHSVKVDAGWLAAPPPAILFHGTVQRHLKSILGSGLMAGARLHVHLSQSIEAATRVGARRGKPIVLEVAAAKLAATGHQFYLSSNGVWLTDHVPPTFLRQL
jgi:putative RNA 2'-phosphotransferase